MIACIFPNGRNNKVAKFSGGATKYDNELKSLVKKVSDECKVCKIYRKAPPWPIVVLPMTKKIQESVAMDLKLYKGKILIHLVDHATGLSLPMVVKSKISKEIINAMF